MRNGTHVKHRREGGGRPRAPLAMLTSLKIVFGVPPIKPQPLDGDRGHICALTRRSVQTRERRLVMSSSIASPSSA